MNCYEICNNCYFCVVKDTEIDKGECHFYPPIVKTIDNKLVTVHPIVNLKCKGCSKYRDNTTYGVW